MPNQPLRYQNYIPLYINGKRDKAKRYVRASNPNDIISVRQYQKYSHLEGTTTPTRTGKPKPRKSVELKQELAARQKYEKEQKRKAQELSNLLRYYLVTTHIEQGQGLNSALRQEHISRDVFNRINEQEQGRVGRVYDTKGKRIVGHAVSSQAYRAVWAIPALDKNGTPIPVYIEVGPAMSSVMGQYWHAVKVLEETGNPAPLNELAGIQVVATDGNIYTLPDATTILLWLSSQSDEFRQAFEKTLYLRTSGQSLKGTGVAA